MIRPGCHVLSPWLGNYKLGLMFGLSCPLGMLLLHDSCNLLPYFLCCCLMVNVVLLWFDMICFMFGMHL